MLLVLAFTAEDRPLIERIYLSKSPALRKLAYRYLKDEQATILFPAFRNLLRYNTIAMTMQNRLLVGHHRIIRHGCQKGAR